MDWVLSVVLFLYGAVFGSFLNVVILRSIAGKSIAGRSSCPHCGHKLSWQELIPVISYVLQRGRCRTCKAVISTQYPIVELFYGICFALLYPDGQALIFAALLLVLLVIDLRTFLLPDFFIVLLGVIALFTKHPSLSGFLAGSGFLLFLWIVTRGRGIGFGDVKLMIPVGLYFGLAATIGILFVAFSVGALGGLLLMAMGKATRKTAIPFGPFLAGAALSGLLFPGYLQTLVRLLYGM